MVSSRHLSIGGAVFAAALLLVSFVPVSHARMLSQNDREPSAEAPAPLGACAIMPASFCTTDINQCGGSSVCGCPEGYSFNPSVGLCLLEDIKRASGPGIVELPRPGYGSQCVQETTGACDRQVPNNCGFQSICQCENDQYEWSPQVGKCLLKL
mmetsp:Transcript_16703/g.42844  ORF Transcript_16703/g.42844 Transcript_16703/m.42844 type:complete len:154 (+) Transcript_16703:273-734(+)